MKRFKNVKIENISTHNEIFRYRRESYWSCFQGKAEFQEISRFTGSSDSNHFIFEINVGKSRIRHRMTLNLSDPILNRFWFDLETQFQIRSKSDPTLSDNNFKNEIGQVWLPLTVQPETKRTEFNSVRGVQLIGDENRLKVKIPSIFHSEMIDAIGILTFATD